MSARAMIPAAVGSALMVVLGLVASDGSLLPALLLFSALVQGTIALAAAAELSKGRWILPARKAMLSLHPMMIPIAMSRTLPFLSSVSSSSSTSSSNGTY